LTRTLPAGWGKLADAKLISGGSALHVTTSDATEAYQVWSSNFPVSAGAYYVVVDGRVDDGGIEIGALDARRNRWIKINQFSIPPPNAAGTVMATRFEVKKRTLVRVILANWHGARSHWTLHSVRVLQVRPRATSG
jgi:hypothetical protein